ncbi:unnamed protein product [Spirodela intermedia]|uniref:Integrase catalytic domain-containing protein n=1 Tax=Spirodela intermedia TaxID=51605 RepID=A0A7I8JXB4_SPIIN|nr:unnamed protein product [Spirodela intermedia]
MLHPFIIQTDQYSLKFLLDQKEIHSEYHKWVIKLMGFNFQIQYKEGKKNTTVDALSRAAQLREAVVAIMCIAQGIDVTKINKEVEDDERLSKIKIALIEGSTSFPHYSIQQGSLLYKTKLVLPLTSILLSTLLREFHDIPLGAHAGFLKTYQQIAQHIYWPAMKKRIKQHINECTLCQLNKVLTLSPIGLLQPLPILNMTWEDLSMDFIGLPKSKCCDSILVIVDRINKFGHFIPLRHLFTAKDIAQIFAKESIKLHGIPRSIVTDRGTVFTSTFWKALNKLQGIELKMSSFYHPQTDEQTEVLRSDWLHWDELNCNTSHHSAIKMTPFKVVHGWDPPTLTCYGSPMSPIIAVNTYLKERNDTLQLLKEHLLAAQSKMKAQVDKHQRDRVKWKAKKKLSPRIFGPYPIQERIGQVAYKLELPSSITIYPIFHISQLCKALGNSAYYQPIPSILTDALEWNVTPQDILAIRNSSFDTEVLVK